MKSCFLKIFPVDESTLKTIIYVFYKNVSNVIIPTVSAIFSK
ncbi:hypothetical protein [Polaromonas sp. CG9_12]|nr:hypothetical protein [Polaromonas sp. CG9_12]